MARLVVDASVALKWKLEDEEETEAAMAILTDFGEGRVNLVAPTLLIVEVANGLHVAVGRGRISEDQAKGFLHDLLALDLTFIADAGFVPRAFELARQHRRSVYDTLYLAIAEAQGCECVTADGSLYQSVKKRLHWVKWVGDYRPLS